MRRQLGEYLVQATFLRVQRRVHLAVEDRPGGRPVLIMEERGGGAEPAGRVPYAHPNLPAVLADHQERETRYRVLELPRGERLDRLISRPLSEEQALALTVQICAAMEHLHCLAPPVALGYLSPRWVRVDDRGRVCVNFLAVEPGLDGAAAHIDPEYAAPEAMAGHPRTASDIYSVGMMLGRMTGMNSVVRRKIRGTLTAALIEQAIARRPGDRPPSMTALRGSLEQRQAQLALRRSWDSERHGRAANQPVLVAPARWAEEPHPPTAGGLSVPPPMPLERPAAAHSPAMPPMLGGTAPLPAVEAPGDGKRPAAAGEKPDRMIELPGGFRLPAQDWIDWIARSLPKVEPRHLPVVVMAGVVGVLIFSLLLSVIFFPRPPAAPATLDPGGAPAPGLMSPPGQAPAESWISPPPAAEPGATEPEVRDSAAEQPAGAGPSGPDSAPDPVQLPEREAEELAPPADWTGPAATQPSAPAGSDAAAPAEGAAGPGPAAPATGPAEPAAPAPVAEPAPEEPATDLGSEPADPGLAVVVNGTEAPGVRLRIRRFGAEVSAHLADLERFLSGTHRWEGASLVWDGPAGRYAVNRYTFDMAGQVWVVLDEGVLGPYGMELISDDGKTLFFHQR